MDHTKISQEQLECFKAAGEYQVVQIIQALNEKGLFFSQDDVAARVMLAFHSYSITDKILKQIEVNPKKLKDMNMKERYDAAGWPKHQPGQNPGNRETSRAVIENLMEERIPERPQSIKDKIGTAQKEAAHAKNRKSIREMQEGWALAEPGMMGKPSIRED